MCILEFFVLIGTRWYSSTKNNLSDSSLTTDWEEKNRGPQNPLDFGKNKGKKGLVGLLLSVVPHTVRSSRVHSGSRFLTTISLLNWNLTLKEFSHPLLKYRICCGVFLSLKQAFFSALFNNSRVFENFNRDYCFRFWIVDRFLTCYRYWIRSLSSQALMSTLVLFKIRWLANMGGKSGKQILWLKNRLNQAIF